MSSPDEVRHQAEIFAAQHGWQPTSHAAVVEEEEYPIYLCQVNGKTQELYPLTIENDTLIWKSMNGGTYPIPFLTASDIQEPAAQQPPPPAALEDSRLTAFMAEQRAFMAEQNARWQTQHELNQETEQKELALEKQTRHNLEDLIQEEHTTQNSLNAVNKNIESLESRINQLDSAVKEHDVHALRAEVNNLQGHVQSLLEKNSQQASEHAEIGKIEQHLKQLEANLISHLAVFETDREITTKEIKKLAAELQSTANPRAASAPPRV